MARTDSDLPLPPGDLVLAGERAFLGHVGECLAHMRSTAEALVDVGGDAYASERLGAQRAERLRSLADLPDVPAFFGRIDQEERGLHIGRRHVVDPAGDPQVIDWRAPVSRTYYQASPQDPQGLVRRRRFGFSRGELTSYEDEDLTRAGAADEHDDGDGEQGGEVALGSLVVAEIERPRSGPMRDIVATIQPDQDDIVRAPLEESVCIQGAPGTGKTAVGLHRAAFLLYGHAERLRRGGVLVVGPNRAFLHYIDQVLPALGEVDVTQCTVADLGPAVAVRTTDAPEAEAVKADPRMAEVLRRALLDGVREPVEDVVLELAARRYRVRAHRAAAVVRTLAEKVAAPEQRREVYYAAARTRLARAVAEDARRQGEAAGFAPTDGETARAARSKPVKAAVDALWPARRAVDLLADLYSDPALLARAADGILDADEQASLRWESRPRSLARAPWTAADVVLLDEVEGLLERPETFEHIVVDEAQDLTAMQCRAIGRRLATGSLTVLGDLAQATHHASLGRWSAVMAHLGRPQATVRPLTVGYRVPGEVLDFAARLLPSIAPDLPGPRAARRAPGSLRLREAADLVEVAADRAAQEGSTAVICADAAVEPTAAVLRSSGLDVAVLGDSGTGEQLSGQVVVVPAGLAKGLEHDHVVVVDPTAILSAEPRGLQRLYVVLTRAVTSLTVVGAEGLPAELT